MRRTSKNISIAFSFSWPLILILGYIASFDVKFDTVGLLFLAIVAQCSFVLAASGVKALNLISVYFLFVLVFLALIPWLHYSYDHHMWRSSPIPDAQYALSNILILLSNFLIMIIYKVAFSNSSRVSISSQPRAHRKEISFLLVLLSLSGFIGVLYLNNFSMVQLLVRGVVDSQRETREISSSLTLIFSSVFRLTPLFCFLYAVTELPKKRFLKFLLFIILLFSVFPTGVPRYLAAFVYIPVLVLLFPTLQRASTFSASLTLSIIFIFPFLEQFRYFSELDQISYRPEIEFFFAAHFDAYENMSSAIEAEFITFGYQLLGVFLFFVPRSVWATKPVGSGYELAQDSGYIFQNISMPFLGEGYVNFGVLGIVLFSVVIGVVMGKLDKRFVLRRGDSTRIGFEKAVYFFVFGALFFILRGDLLSSFSYCVAALTVAWMVSKFTRLLRR